MRIAPIDVKAVKELFSEILISSLIVRSYRQLGSLVVCLAYGS